jgi:hypothetical protein
VRQLRRRCRRCDGRRRLSSRAGRPDTCVYVRGSRSGTNRVRVTKAKGEKRSAYRSRQKRDSEPRVPARTRCERTGSHTSAIADRPGSSHRLTMDPKCPVIWLILASPNRIHELTFDIARSALRCPYGGRSDVDTGGWNDRSGQSCGSGDGRDGDCLVLGVESRPRVLHASMEGLGKRHGHWEDFAKSQRMHRR